MVEIPPPPIPAESKIVQAVAGRARTIDPSQDPLQIGARSRVRTRPGSWLLLYGCAPLLQPAAHCRDRHCQYTPSLAAC
jgi:hypothetical protein